MECELLVDYTVCKDLPGTKTCMRYAYLTWLFNLFKDILSYIQIADEV